MIPEMRFVSDLGRPGVCCTPGCNHDEFDHLITGRCRRCQCPKYDPPRFFDED